LDVYLFRSLGIIAALVCISVYLVYFMYTMIFNFQKKSVSKKLLLIVMTCTALYIANSLYYQYFFTFEQVEGEHLQAFAQPIYSKDKMYQAQAYIDVQPSGERKVLVEIINKQTNEQKFIYYNLIEGHFEMKWLGEGMLEITNPNEVEGDTSLTLNVVNDIYHDSGLACQSLLLWDTFENCYKQK
jgi:hypothetical protein